MIIFDLDGVLYDSKKFHFEALNKALNKVSKKYEISFQEHVNIYDGLPTLKKLELLTSNKGLDITLHESIWQDKQIITAGLLDQIELNTELKKNLETLKEEKYKLAVASNSIKKTVIKVLENLNIIQLFDLIISNEDVLNAKPHPEMYWNCMSQLKILPKETFIIEDSPVGRLGAKMSGANYLFVNSSDDLNNAFFENILNYNDDMSDLNKYYDKNLNVLIPMAGKGSRFSEKGYVFPKPLIEINGKPMIQIVVENINIEANYIFIVLQEHIEKYNIDKMLKLIVPNCTIVVTDGITEGAASTTLLAKQFINNDNPLVIANSDQYIEWNPREAMYNFTSKDIDGGILTFNSTHPKWSYAKTDDNGTVTEVAEKNPISTNATVGIYYWKAGKNYVTSAEEMIEKNIRVNNEFYVCPVYNQAIEKSQKIIIEEINEMWGIGTPEDLDTFLQTKLLK
ncbi:MAG: HAD-IA family hydrolase [Alphaproteobacteria bacterium]|nr:HAD-IA family hydrolase [Alphaproteobacteria bacterium]